VVDLIRQTPATLERHPPRQGGGVLTLHQLLERKRIKVKPDASCNAINRMNRTLQSIHDAQPPLVIVLREICEK
jgi:hypothetical protein